MDINNTNNNTRIAAAADVNNDDWQRRIRELQGAVILASLVEVVLGVTGLVGVLLRYIGPLTIAPVITMVALPLVNECSKYCQYNWLIAFLYVHLAVSYFLISSALVLKNAAVIAKAVILDFSSHRPIL